MQPKTFKIDHLFNGEEGGLIAEPYMVQTSYRGGKAVSLDLPEHASRAFQELLEQAREEGRREVQEQKPAP